MMSESRDRGDGGVDGARRVNTAAAIKCAVTVIKIINTDLMHSRNWADKFFNLVYIRGNKLVK